MSVWGRAAAGGPAAPLGEAPRPGRRADDRERAIGLVAALVAALVTSALAAHHAGGASGLFLVLAGLAAVILTGALARRRVPLGAGASLYGLAVFDLHFWGFGLPFVLVGAWLLVRAYRARPVPATAAPVTTHDDPTAVGPAGHERHGPSLRGR